jgi:hypothetical protein
MPQTKPGEPAKISSKVPSGVRILPPGVHLEGESVSIVTLEGKSPGKGYLLEFEEFGVRAEKPGVAEVLIPWGRVQVIEYAVK